MSSCGLAGFIVQKQFEDPEIFSCTVLFLSDEDIHSIANIL